MSYLCDLFFIFTLIFIIINHIISRHTCFLHILQIILNQFWIKKWRKEVNDFEMAKVQPQGVIQLSLHYLLISATLLVKVLLIQKSVQPVPVGESLNLNVVTWNDPEVMGKVPKSVPQAIFDRFLIILLVLLEAELLLLLSVESV